MTTTEQTADPSDTPTTENDYITKILTDAENGDWREVLHRLAASNWWNSRLFAEQIRGMQAAYAAGLVHGPNQAMTWLGNSLDAAAPNDENGLPDPSWFGSWLDRKNRPVPANCATMDEAATAPATQVHPGFTGMDPQTGQAADGRWWATASPSMFVGSCYMVAFTDQLADARTLRLDVDQWLAGQDAKPAVPVEWWRPADLSEAVGSVTVHPDLDGPAFAVFTTAGEHGYVRADYRRWVEANLPDIGDGVWTVEQLGGPLGPLRWTDPVTGQAWAYVMPANVKAADDPEVQA